MPTAPGVKGESLNPQQTLEKFAGLIQESDTEPAEPTVTPDVSPVPTPSEPAPQSSDTEPPASEPDVYDLVVDGEPVQVDLEELKSGYSRDADYRRKTMALAEERRSFETEAEQTRRERGEYQQALGQLTEALRQLQGEPDWDKLHQELAPADFLKHKADWEYSQANLQRLQAEHERVAQTTAHDAAQRYQAFVRAEQDKLKVAIPEWAQPETQKAEQGKLAATAKSYGFSEQEIASVTDHRAVLLLRDAMRYRELHREPNAQSKAKVSSIKPAKPGSPERPRPNERQTKLIERVTQTHRSVDAAKAIEAMLPD